MRIGLFGGTFNPIHLGHLRSAEEIRQVCVLDHIYFIPSARPPHKGGQNIAPAQDRLNMVELAVADHSAFSASAVELERSGPSYSVDTIRFFLSACPSAELFFIVGLDAFLDIHTWKAYETIPDLCHVIVTSRPGMPLPTDSFLPVAFQTAFCYDSKLRMYRHPSHHTLVLHQIIGLDISASAIRREIRHGHSVRYLVPRTVETYIAEHALYQQERSLS